MKPPSSSEIPCLNELTLSATVLACKPSHSAELKSSWHVHVQSQTQVWQCKQYLISSSDQYINLWAICHYTHKGQNKHRCQASLSSLFLQHSLPAMWYASPPHCPSFCWNDIINRRVNNNREANRTHIIECFLKIQFSEGQRTNRNTRL